MGTFVGYEVISPAGNFNYSISYLFTNGPFQNAGVKLDYAITDRIGVMVGAFNPWNVYTAPDSIGPSGRNQFCLRCAIPKLCDDQSRCLGP